MNVSNATSLSAGDVAEQGFEVRLDVNNLFYAGAGLLIGALLTASVFFACLQLQRRRHARESDLV